MKKMKLMKGKSHKRLKNILIQIMNQIGIVLLVYNINAGKNFYSSFSHEAKTFIFFYEGQIAVLLYKLG